ncbi:hypothetical protein MTO96_050810 [Rhipicephalus appendiculatus]
MSTPRLLLAVVIGITHIAGNVSRFVPDADSCVLPRCPGEMSVCYRGYKTERDCYCTCFLRGMLCPALWWLRCPGGSRPKCNHGWPNWCFCSCESRTRWRRTAVYGVSNTTSRH